MLTMYSCRSHVCVRNQRSTERTHSCRAGRGFLDARIRTLLAAAPTSCSGADVRRRTRVKGSVGRLQSAVHEVRLLESPFFVHGRDLRFGGGFDRALVQPLPLERRTSGGDRFRKEHNPCREGKYLVFYLRNRPGNLVSTHRDSEGNGCTWSRYRTGIQGQSEACWMDSRKELSD